ncbi:MAG: hypothetical protein AAGF12_05860 [Myxococcota bacterium]
MVRSGTWGTLVLLAFGALSGCIRDFDRSLLEDDGDGCTNCALTDIGVSGTLSCALHRDGRLWCWGSNEFGQLGLPEQTNPTRTPQLLPGQFEHVSTGNDSAITACAVDDASGLFCWGAGSSGQAGLGSPRSAEMPTAVGTSLNWTDISVGVGVSCGVREGELSCWGWAAEGRLGFMPPGSFQETPARLPITEPIQAVSVARLHGCAVAESGTLWCWGGGDDGRRGYEGPSVPPQQVHGDARYRSVSTGIQHTCGIRDDASLWCWGDNSLNQLGVDGPGGAMPQRIPEPSAWRTVSAGDDYTCGITVSDELYCWGDGRSGRLGLGSTDSAQRPTRVGELREWGLVDTGYNHTCGATRAGQLYCWGGSAMQANGHGTTVTIPTPVFYE